MNFLFINSIQMWGGAEVWLMDIMHGLEKRGHRTTLICRPGTILEKNALAEGFDVVPVKMRSDFDPFVIWKVAQIIRQRDIHVLSTNMDKELRFGGVAAKLAGVKAVVPSREVDYPLKNKWRYRFTYNVLADKIIANSQSTKNTLLKNAPWLDPQRIEVVYKGIDPKPYLTFPEEGQKIREEFGIPRDVPLIGFVGQIIERKGIPDILESIPIVLQQNPETRFLFAGEGELTTFLIQTIRDYGVEDRVLYTGFRKDIPAIMKAIDLLLLPSTVEGFGYVLVEAMAAAKPVVATHVSSIPEIVEDGKTGILIDVHQPRQLAQAILSLLNDSARSKKLGENGRKRVLERFTLKTMIDQFEIALLDAVFRKTTRPDAGPRFLQSH